MSVLMALLFMISSFGAFALQGFAADNSSNNSQGWVGVKAQWKYKIDVPQRLTKDSKLILIVNNGNSEIGRADFSGAPLKSANLKNVPQEIKNLIGISVEYKDALTKQSQLQAALEAIAKQKGIITPQASGQWQTLSPKEWRMRVDDPDSGAGKVHVHVENTRTGQTAVENVDGTESHGQTMTSKGIPKSVQNQVKDNEKYKKGIEKQKKLDDAKAKIKSKNLKIDWWHVWDVIIAIGIVVAATATFFFPGDDVAAWINFFRAIGVAA